MSVKFLHEQRFVAEDIKKGGVIMVKIKELKVGQVTKSEFDKIDRELLKKYAKASGDTNPLHTNDDFAIKAGLKGVIAHGLFSFGFAPKLFEDFLGHGKFGSLIDINLDMRAMVRCGDQLITEGTISKIEGKRVFFDVKQTTITPVDIKDKSGKIVKKFEAGERGYISEKDIAEGLVKTKQVEEGTLTYREQIATNGTAIVDLKE